MSGWSWKLGRVAGIDVYVHATFLVLLAWIGVTHFLERHRLADAASGIVFILALFAIVVLHELGHALTARHYGIRTRDITLLPIGGMARLERMPDDPKQELLVALAGPAVNVVLAAALYAILMPAAPLASWPELQRAGGDFLVKLLWINVSLAAFNLLPAFPMDGGRALRALLAMRMDSVRATQLAARVGQAMALLFGLAGLFGNPVLVFIALFVWMGAASEASMVERKSAFAGIPVSRAMVTDFETLSPTETLERAIGHALDGFQDDFPVVDGGRVVGLLTRAGLLRGLARTGVEAMVASAMTSRFEIAEPSEMLDGAVQRLEAAGGTAAPVVRDGALVGLLTLDNAGELLMLQAARRRESPRPAVAS